MIAGIVPGKPFAVDSPLHVTPALQHLVLRVETITQHAVNAAVQIQQRLDPKSPDYLET